MILMMLKYFVRCLLDLGAKLQQCHESGAITALMRARRDATVLHDCESELNAACLDMQVRIRRFEDPLCTRLIEHLRSYSWGSQVPIATTKFSQRSNGTKSYFIRLSRSNRRYKIILPRAPSYSPYSVVVVRLSKDSLGKLRCTQVQILVSDKTQRKSH